MKKIRKKPYIAVFITALVIILFGSGINIRADESNGEAGNEGEHSAASAGYYLSSQWGWRVSVYVAKDIGYTDEEYKSLSLYDDFHYIGKINMKRSGFRLPAKTYLGIGNKLEYMNGQSFDPTLYYTVWDYDCPAPPACCYGNISEVNSYFLNNELILDVLEKISVERNLDSISELVDTLTFCRHFVRNGVNLTETLTGAQIGYRNILPYEARENYLPWVIVYEPMICTYLAGDTGAAFLSATEYALSQGAFWNWGWTDNAQCYFYGNYYPTSGKKPQCMQRISFQLLPMSVMLEQPWFGFSVGNIKTTQQSYTLNYILHNGGWGMGYLTPMPYDEVERELLEGINLSLSAILPNAVYHCNTEVVSGFYLKNLSNSRNIYPFDGINVIFTVTDQLTGEQLVSQKLEGVCLPANETTVVWFNWKVLLSGGQTAVLSAQLELPSNLTDSIETDNCTVYENTVSDPLFSFTENSLYTEYPPDGFELSSFEETPEQSVSWYEWLYEDEEFYKITYTASTAGCSAMISPDSKINSSYEKDGEWYIKSGYGFTFEGECSMVSGFTNVPENSVTPAQSCYVLFPENGYSLKANEFDSTEIKNGKFVLHVNETSVEAERVHYIPLWYPDTDERNGINQYYVSAIFCDIWTPLGMMYGCVNSNGLNVNGTMYDDWRITGLG